MSDLSTHLDAIETQCAGAMEAYEGVGNLSLLVFPLPDDFPPETVSIGPGQIAAECMDGANWARVLGQGTLVDHGGKTTHRLLYIVTGAGDERAGPLGAFSAIMRRAGTVCYRLQNGLAATGATNSPELTWVNTLYAYLKGTNFVTEKDGYSRMRSLFAASLQVLSLLHRGDASGRAPAYAGCLRPGIPGSLAAIDLGEVRPLSPAELQASPPSNQGGGEKEPRGDNPSPAVGADPLLAVSDLANQLGVENAKDLDDVLARLRKNDFNCFTEMSNRQKNKPKYLYYLSRVWDELVKWRDAREKRQKK